MLLNLFRLLRAKDWIKNIFVIAPLVFSGQFLLLNSVYDILIVMIFFCLSSSAVYIFNDIHDFEIDRLHEKKLKIRPIANGSISIPFAYSFFYFFFILMSLSWFFNEKVTFILFIYLIMNIFYTLKIKEIPLLDILSIAFGFLLRVFAGSIILNVSPSPWILTTTLCFALFLAGVKRKSELMLFGAKIRPVLDKYSVSVLDLVIQTSLTTSIVFYSLFTITSKPELIVTIPFVIFGFFRFIYIFDKYDLSSSPVDILLKDFQLMANFILWFILCVWVNWPI